jgi:2-C-methyl-D-erythritol 4-phosphate cytidylyltransferase/2-C-methyl-D-erythritol 2,4-cyclodiphosphate synthase
VEGRGLKDLPRSRGRYRAPARRHDHAPKISPHRNQMRENLASILGISLDRCSVKATTNETIGFVGRREGIAAIATATVVYRGTET